MLAPLRSFDWVIDWFFYLLFGWFIELVTYWLIEESRLLVCGTAEAHSGSKHHRFSCFHSGRRRDRSAIISAACPGAGGSPILGVPVGDRGPGLPHGLGQRDADKRDVTGHTSHLVQLKSRRANHHCRRLLPRDEADPVVDQRADGGLRCSLVRDGPDAGRTRRRCRHWTHKVGTKSQQPKATRGQEQWCWSQWC